MCNRNLHDCIHVSIPANCALDIFATGKRVNHGVECGLEIPANFHFDGPEKAIKLAKTKNKDRRKRKQNFKTLSKVKCIQSSYKKCFTWLVIGRVRYKEVYSRG